MGLLVKARYITRKISKTDRRRTKLTVTELGVQTIEAVDRIVLANRSHALQNIPQEDVELARRVMLAITQNCAK